jgi:hypothetical protein
MMPSRAATIAALRAHLAEVAPHRGVPKHIPTGLPILDAALGGWPAPGVGALHGPVGSGRLGLVLPALQGHTQAERTVAVVDAMGWLHPPGLPGVDLRHLMLVRPGSARAGWAATQLAGSGAIPLVVLLDPPRLGREGLRLVRAADSGCSTVLVISEDRDMDLPAQLRIAVLGQGRVRIQSSGSPQMLELHGPSASKRLQNKTHTE